MKLWTKLLMMAFAICTMLALASCGAKPKSDLEDVAKNLEKAGYDVDFEDDQDPEENEGLVGELEAEDEYDNELMIAVFDSAKLAKIAYKMLKLERDAMIYSYERQIDMSELRLQEKKAVLSKYEDDMSREEIKALEEDIEKAEDNLKELKKNLKEYKKENVIGRSGKMVWKGTKEAIKDSK